jgi:hypothetical protein
VTSRGRGYPIPARDTHRGDETRVTTSKAQPAAVAFLTTAFGFSERVVHADDGPDGIVRHAELTWDATWRTPTTGAASSSSRTTKATCGASGTWYET